jgi:hypothetical protein
MLENLFTEEEKSLTKEISLQGEDDTACVGVNLHGVNQLWTWLFQTQFFNNI